MAEMALFQRQRGFLGLPSALSSAVLEWLLILLLFANACFSFIVTKFARYCKLKTPCLFCSRLDHILGSEEPGFHKHLICDNHISEISSWSCCDVHKRIADSHEICQGRVLPFAADADGSNSEPLISSLAGKSKECAGSSENVSTSVQMYADCDDQQPDLFGGDLSSVPLLHRDHESKSHVMHCPCCSFPLDNNLLSEEWLKNKSIGSEVTQFDNSKFDLPPLDSLHATHSAEMAEIPVGSTTFYQSTDDGFDRLCHVGYSELKVSSDAESDILYSDGEVNAFVHDKDDLEGDAAPEISTILEKSVAPLSTSVVSASMELTYPHPILVEASVAVPEKSHQTERSHELLSKGVSDANVHGLEQLNWNEAKVEANLPSSSESSSHIGHADVSNAKLDFLEAGDAVSNNYANPVSSQDSNTAETSSKTIQIVDDSGRSMHISMDLNDAYRLAIGNKTNPFSPPTVSEIITGKDFSKVHEDLKLLLSQISGSRSLEFPSNDFTPSPRVHGLDISDATSSIILQNITKSLSIESGGESLDGSVASEIEGESPLDRLNRQIILDRKSISLLYKELEEERSASTIAANQAMAMITRLQEEKAAMQMEALQYQRMMEEQAEYDQEALQKSNDLLAQREKEILDLEEEIESCRKEIIYETPDDRLSKPVGDSEAMEDLGEGTSQDEVVQNSETLSGLPKHFPFDFEEKVYIAESLKNLEKRLVLFSNNGDAPLSEGEHSCLGGVSNANEDAMFEEGNKLSEDDTANDKCSREGDSDLESDHVNDTSQANGHMKGSNSSKETSFFPCRRDQCVTKEIFLSNGHPFENNDNPEGDTPSLLGHDRQNSHVTKVGGFFDIKNEILRLNDRLLALEGDRNFLEHAVNSLRQGNAGFRFIEEIACHLRELRRTVIA